MSIEEVTDGPDKVRRTARAEYFRNQKQTDAKEIFFEISGRDVAKPLPTADWAVLAVLFKAMRKGQTIYIDAPISKPLLDNLEEFQEAFAMWLPDLTPVEIIAQSEVEPTSVAPEDAVLAFSGGVDATFTAYRHLFKKHGRRHKNLKTAMLVHGFDVTLDKEHAFQTSLDSARRILEGTGVELATVRTNVKQTQGYSWEQGFLAALGSCLHQFAGSHGAALIASGETYKDAAFPWGSNPATNRMLGSDHMKFIPDATAVIRTQKVSHISRWKEARDNIRVCWEGPITGRNCGKCEKCIRTILNFRAVGQNLPAAFAEDATDAEISRLKPRSKLQLLLFVEILEAAQANGLSGSWMDELRNVVDRGIRTN